MNRLITGKVALILVLAGLSFFVIFKAVHIPITFDESSSFGLCEQPIWQIMMNQNWDGSPSSWPNNHILNTILMKYSSAIFGTQPWALRLPNILAFLMFGVCMYLLALRYFSSSLWLLFLPVIFMFGNPYLIDFYSVARGYGMGCALMACSILGLLAYTSSYRMRWYYVATIFAGLAVYAQFTFVLYWLAIHILLSGILVREAMRGRRIWHELLASGIVASIFVALCWYPLLHTQKGISHDFPASGSFFDVTILTSAANFIYTKKSAGLYTEILSWIAVGIVIASGVYCFRKVCKDGRLALTQPLVLLFTILVLVWAINLLQANIFHSMYPGQRTALIYYVLFAFVLMFLVRDMIADNVIEAKVITSVLMIFFVANFYRAANLKSVREWSYDAYTYDVVNYIDTYRQKHPEARIGLKLGGHFFPSFFYYHYMNYNKLRWLDMVTRFDTVTQPLFFYGTAEERPIFKNYMPVQIFGPDSQVLMIHK
jgi:hypothetical protein